MPPEREDEHMDWKKEFLPFIAKYGVATVLSIYLVWFVTTTIDNRMDRLELGLTAHQSETRDLKNSIDSLTNSTDSLTTEQSKGNLILQQICVNGAAINQRQNCFR